MFVDGNALSRDRGLIHRALPVDHEAVGRNARVRPHEHAVTNDELLDRDLLLLAALASDDGGLGGELRQRLDGTAGTAHGVSLEGVAEAEEEEEQRPLDPLAQRPRSGGGDEHQKVDLQTLGSKGLEHLADRVVAPEEVCRPKQHPSQGPRTLVN